MKVWGRTPAEARANPHAAKHWIEVHSGVPRDPMPSTKRGWRRLKAKAAGKTQKQSA